MNPTLQLLSGRGTLSRRPFILITIVLVISKLLLDRLLFMGFELDSQKWGRTFSSLYLGIFVPEESDLRWMPSFLAIALPYLWMAIVLTLARLRSIGWPLGLAILIFIPAVKLLFAIALAITPQKEAADGFGERNRPLARLIPSSGPGAAILGILVGAAFGLFSIWLIAQELHAYGWSLFVATPFLVGFLSTFCYNFHEHRGLGASFGISALALALSGMCLLAFALEGIICLIMAAPIGLGICAIGTVTAHTIISARTSRQGHTYCFAVLGLPLIAVLEKTAPTPPEVRPVRTEILVAAPPETVWKHVVSFPDLPPPHEPIFRAGIAYPVRARLEGTGVGAIRHCEFTTGAFVEPVVVWDEPRLLKFTVTSTPAPMEEWTPYRDVHPPHLEGFLVSEQGQFELIRTENGSTRLIGTTWYQHGLFPDSYWRLWSDYIIHTIHLRVLRHVKTLAELQPASGR